MSLMFFIYSKIDVVSNYGTYPPSGERELVPYLCMGPLCRYATDLIPMTKVLAGKNAPLMHLDDPVRIFLICMLIYSNYNFCTKTFLLISHYNVHTFPFLFNLLCPHGTLKKPAIKYIYHFD